jgi:predicted metal-dependent hydrolase
MPRSNYTKHYLDIEGHAVPLKVYREWRRNASFSITNSSVILRLPRTVRKSQLERFVQDCTERTQHYFQQHPAIRQRFIRKQYADQDQLVIGNRTYPISINWLDRKTDSGRIKDDQILLRMNDRLANTTRQERIRRLLSRVIAQDQLPAITQRVERLNQSHFRQDIRSVRLKYNHSNWGSCSSNGTINLSTRLLFAPEEVIDYVIIHELAHLIELNHSSAYWKLVAAAMPDYQRHIKWLRQFGPTCDF